MILSHVPARQLALATLITFSAPLLRAATYYVDPAKGKISNPGTSSSPWSTLEEVFAKRKTFSGGDVILLRSGYHGEPTIRGKNASNVTIKPESGHAPKLGGLLMDGASRWVLTDLDFSPLHAGANKFSASRIIEIRANSSYITLKDSRIRSAFSVAGWNESDWKKKAGGAIQCRAHHSLITGNVIEHVGSGIYLTQEAEYTVISHNTIRHVRDDGLRGSASHCTFEYNTISNFYAIDGNHDDGFQSFSVGSSGSPGTGVVKNVVLRGNVFISYTDPAQPYKSEMQGIGCFDGMFEDWVIENNVIVTDMWHGIALFGATNCRIVNNTVVKNPINARGHTPWIEIRDHKKGKASKGNVVSNNLTSGLKVSTDAATKSNNLETTSYTSHFANWAKFDLRLKSGSLAINAGTASRAPGLDIDLRTRSTPPDVGAYEYGGSGSTPPAPPPPVPTDGDDDDDDDGGSATTQTFEVEKLARKVGGASVKVQKESSASGGSVLYFNANGSGDYVEFTTGKLPAGKYAVKLRLKRGNNRGQHNVKVNGSTIGGTVEHFSSRNSFVDVSLGQVTVSSAGTRTVRLTVTGKNRAAKSYVLAPDRLTFSPL